MIKTAKEKNREVNRKASDAGKPDSGRIKIKDMLFLHIVLVFYTFGSIMSKKAAGYDFLSVGFCFFYGMVLVISLLYAFLWQKVLKRLPLVMAYANKAVTVIWGLVWGYLFFKESVTLWNLAGAGIIIFGVYLVVSGEENG